MKSQYVEKTVTVDGTDVTYRVSGPLNDRLPLILIPGAGGSIDSHFGFMFPMMAFRQRVIAINLAEPATDKVELAHFAAQVSAVIDAEAPDGPVSLLGYALGVPIAVKTAYELGDKIANLVLVGGFMRTDTHQKLRHQIWTALQNEGSPLVGAFMAYTSFSPFFMKSRSVDDVLATGRLTITPFVEKQMELAGRIDVVAECERIQARTLVVAFADDYTCPRHHSKMLFGTIPNASYTEISSGHGVVHERPAELFYHVDRFCKEPTLYPVGEIIPAHKP